MNPCNALASLVAAVLLSGCGGGDSSSGNVPPAAPPGTLDSSFGTGGIAVTPVSTQSNASAIVLQPDGKIVVAGAAFDGTNHLMVLVRYNANGSPDPTFGSAGKVVTQLGLGYSNPGFYRSDRSNVGLALQPDGKIVAAGGYLNGNGCALIRYNTDGALDVGFGGNGIVAAQVSVAGGGILCHAVAVQADGKIVVAAESSAYVVMRFNGDGTRDLTFGSSGAVVIPCSFNRSCLPYSLLIQPDGKLVVAGTHFECLAGFSCAPGGSDTPVNIVLARLESNGGLDGTFGVNGVVTSGFPMLATASSAALQPDGQIVVAGSNGVTRFLSTGALDQGFGTSGLVTTSISDNNSEFKAIGVQPNGKIVTVGFINHFGSPVFQFLVVRYTAAGTLDSGFGAAGIVITPVASSAFAFATLIQPDGRILVTGRATAAEDDFAVARYFGDAVN